MLYEDSKGNLLTEEQIDELSAWELEDRGIHLSDDFEMDIGRRLGIN